MLIFLNLKECTNFLFILLSTVMFFFCLYLYFNNKKLKERISKLEIETKEILERKLIKENPNDLISLNNLSNNYQEKKISSSKSNNQINKSLNNHNESEIISQKNNQSKNNNSTYQKNKKENYTKIIIKEKEDNTKLTQQTQYKYNFININNENFNIDEFIQKEKREFPKIKENKNPIDYLDEISNQIAEELTPKTIKLTEYEQRQEDQAVISYKELLALKKRLDNNPNMDENINFIENLKDFRNSLK